MTKAKCRDISEEGADTEAGEGDTGHRKKLSYTERETVRTNAPDPYEALDGDYRSDDERFGRI